MSEKNNDVWIHKSAGMLCQTCMYFVEKQDNLGRCRRHAPTMSGFPVVFGNKDWCGDHKLNTDFTKDIKEQ